jgi:hypothetical protein
VALIQKSNQGGSSEKSMYYIGLDVHKKTISYCVKEVNGQIHSEGTLQATREELDNWMKTLPQPWAAAMAPACMYISFWQRRVGQSPAISVRSLRRPNGST